MVHRYIVHSMKQMSYRDPKVKRAWVGLSAVHVVDVESVAPQSAGDFISKLELKSSIF